MCIYRVRCILFIGSVVVSSTIFLIDLRTIAQGLDDQIKKIAELPLLCTGSYMYTYEQ